MKVMKSLRPQHLLRLPMSSTSASVMTIGGEHYAKLSLAAYSTEEVVESKRTNLCSAVNDALHSVMENDPRCELIEQQNGSFLQLRFVVLL
jgi:hypothetical protein